jgi:hypothetical protein
MGSAWTYRNETSRPTLSEILEYFAQGQLTERDLRVLDAVYNAGGVMMTHQIADIVFHGLKPGNSRKTKTRERLRKMFEFFLLSRMWPKSLEAYSSGLSQISTLHFLGPSSTSVLSNRLKVPTHRIRRTQDVAKRLLDSNRLFHDLMVVDIWVTFAKAGRRLGWPVEWRGPRQAYTRVTDGKGKTKNAYAPDGLVIVSNNTSVHPYFIEMDTGSESRKRFVVGKLPGLREVYKTQTFQRQYGTFPMILVVTRTSRRAKSLVEYMKEHVSDRMPVDFRVASISSLREEGVENVQWLTLNGGSERLWGNSEALR